MQQISLVFLYETNKINTAIHITLLYTLYNTVYYSTYTVGIPVFSLVDYYHVILGCDEATSSTSLSWCRIRGVK